MLVGVRAMPWHASVSHHVVLSEPDLWLFPNFHVHQVTLMLLTQVGTPLTHRHFLRRHRGTYGPAIRAGEGAFPGPKTPIAGEPAYWKAALQHRLCSSCMQSKDMRALQACSYGVQCIQG